MLCFRLEQLPVWLWQRPRSSVGADHHVDRPPFSQDCVTALDLVRKLDDAALDAAQCSFHENLIVVTGRSQIAAVCLRDAQICLLFAFEVPITESALAAEIGAPHFHPDKVVGVIHHAHLIGFGVAYAKAASADVGHQAVFKTRDGRSRPSSRAMKYEARRTRSRETPDLMPRRSRR